MLARAPSRPKWPAYLKWRDGRPRWEPGPGVRALGFSGRDLKDELGGWLALGPAIDAAAAVNAEVAAAKAAGGKGRRMRPRPPRDTRTVRDLYERWRQSPKFKKLAAATVVDYGHKAKVFLDAFGDEPVASLRPHHLYSWWEQLVAERGHTMANRVIAVMRSMLSHAPRIGWRADNPARGLDIEGTAPRVVIWTPSEAARFVATADALGLAAIADAAVIALHTAQRQADVLLLAEDRIEGGRARFKQSKTGARVAVPLTDQLAARLAAMRARRLAAAGDVVDLAESRRLFTMNRWQLRAGFDRVREAVAETLPDFAGKTFADLRDTAITRLALAGCTIPEIRAITGHSLETIHTVLKHYLALDDRMADSGIDKLKTYLAEEGIAV